MSEECHAETFMDEDRDDSNDSNTPPSPPSQPPPSSTNSELGNEDDFEYARDIRIQLQERGDDSMKDKKEPANLKEIAVEHIEESDDDTTNPQLNLFKFILDDKLETS